MMTREKQQRAAAMSCTAGAGLISLMSAGGCRKASLRLEVANVPLFLALDESSSITGVDLCVRGGDEDPVTTRVDRAGRRLGSLRGGHREYEQGYLSRATKLAEGTD